jgi:hypothetical protein
MTDTDEAASPDAEEATQEVDNTALPTLADIQQERDEKLTALAGGDSPEAEEEDDTSEDVVEDSEEETEDVEEQEESADKVLSKEYFDALSDEDKEAHLTELKEVTGAAFGKQRKQIRELKQELEAKDEQLKATSSVASTSDSPFGNVHTVEQVDSTITAVEDNIEKYTDALIYESTTEYDEASGNDVRGATVDGKFFSAATIKSWAKEQKANITKLRERKTEIKKVAKLFDDEDTEIETLKQSLNMSEEEATAFEAHIADPSFAVIKSVRPEYAKKLFDILAKASIADRKPKTRKAPKAQNGSAALPKGSNASPKSITSQIKTLEDIVSGKTKAPHADRIAADKKVRALKRKGK